MANKEQRNGMSRKQFKEQNAVQKSLVPGFDVRITNGGKLVNDPSESNQILEAILSNPRELYAIAERSQPANISIHLIANTVASSILKYVKKTKDRNKNEISIENHPLVKPNDEDSQFTFIYKTVVYCLIEGGARWFFGEGKTEVFRPHECPPEYGSNGVLKGYRYRGNLIDRKFIREIGFPGYGPNSYFRSPTKAIISNILLNSESSKAIIEHLRNGLADKGFLINKEAHGMNAKKAQQELANFASKENSVKGIRGLPVGWDFTPISSTLVEAGALEAMKEGGGEVIRGYGIPESTYKSEFTSYATANVQDTAFVKKTIKPYCMMIQDALNASPIVQKDYVFEFDLGDLVSGEERKFVAETEKTQADTASTLKSMGLYSNNEIRKRSGFEIIKDEKDEPLPEANINPLVQDKISALANKSSSDDIRKETLNGAQISSIVQIVQFVTVGQLPRDAASNILMIAFNLDKETAESMLGSAGSNPPATPTPAKPVATPIEDEE